MPITNTLNRDLNFIHEVWSGPISAMDLEKYWKVFLGDPEVLRCRRTLADLRDCVIQFNGHDLGQLVERLVLPVLGTMKWRTAVVTGQPVQFGVVRQYEVFADFYSTDSLFEDEQSALDWLLQKGPEDA